MAKKEHIEREAAIDCLMEILDRPKHAEFLYTDEICGALNSIPAADVRPVVRGKWIMNDDSKTVCSLCGNVVAFVSHPDKRWDFGYFCPNCGAEMEES